MNPPLQQFLAVALPIIAALWIASWSQNKRFDDLRAEIASLRDETRAQFRELRAEMNARFDRVERKVEHHDERIVRLEERTALVR